MSESLSTENYSHDTHRMLPFADKGIWIFVGIDLIIFGLFFLIFLVEKNAAPVLFEQSQQALNPTFGFVNTVILISSSWLVVKSLRTLSNSVAKARRYLVGAMLFGVVFIVCKCFEYGEKFSAGVSIVENSFFTFYYLLTFLHLCHVIGGLIALMVIFLGLKRGRNEALSSGFESVGIYWHMVDLLWIYLFVILYLLP